jgi:hypothetical protein
MPGCQGRWSAQVAALLALDDWLRTSISTVTGSPAEATIGAKVRTTVSRRRRIRTSSRLLTGSTARKHAAYSNSFNPAP